MEALDLMYLEVIWRTCGSKDIFDRVTGICSHHIAEEVLKETGIIPLG